MNKNKELITDEQIKVLALQRLLIYYENLLKRNNHREDIVNTSNRYIAKIRRTLINMLEAKKEVEVEKIESYK
tara:strand:- start:193 stop:411 length:219 start_codon:yes stop_codon:yes gene_type:complete